MNTFRQFLGALFAGIFLLILVTGSLVLTEGDAASSANNIAITLPLPPSLTSVPPSITPTLIPTTSCSRPDGWIDYIVVEGDDLDSIAARFGLDPLALQTANCLDSNIVSAGQNLFVPPPTATPTATITPTFLPGQTPVTPIPTRCGPPLGWKIYIVQRGDTLFSIARATGTTVQQLMFANCLDTDRIRVGQPLFVPRLPIIATATYTPSATPTVPTATASTTPSPTSSTTTAPITNTPSATPSATISVPTTEVPTSTDTPIPSDTPMPTTPLATPTPSPTIDLPPSDTPTEVPSATP